MTHAKVHPNSLAAYETLDLGLRQRRILRAVESSPDPLTDRQIMWALSYTDMNAVRPRVTELVQAGHLAEVGNTTDAVTGRRVRLVTLAGPATQRELF